MSALGLEMNLRQSMWREPRFLQGRVYGAIRDEAEAELDGCMRDYRVNRSLTDSSAVPEHGTSLRYVFAKLGRHIDTDAYRALMPEADEEYYLRDIVHMVRRVSVDLADMITRARLVQETLNSKSTKDKLS